MKNIVTWAVRNTRLVIAALAVTIIAGVIAFIQIPKESDPDIPIRGSWRPTRASTRIAGRRIRRSGGPQVTAG